MKTSSRKSSRSTSRMQHEVGLLGLRQQQQPLDDVLDPPQLVERDEHLGSVRHLALQQLEMPARDRHRRAQLVRGVVEEPLLPLEQRRASSRRAPPPAFIAACRRRACQTIATNIADMSGTSNSSPQSWMPANASLRDRSRRSPRMTTASTASVDRRRPDAEAVDDREADPDEVERDRLPARPGDHRGEVRERRTRPSRSRPSYAAASR